jgi:2'-5' RNA ligase
MAQSLILVRVPELEPHVASLRARFDPSARRGLGAHVTILHSNLPAGRIDPTTPEQVAVVASSLSPFDYRITRVARFPGTLYLAVEPAAPFARLRERLCAVLPVDERERRRHEPFIPHVSVVRKSAIDDGEVEAELAAMLLRHAPIACACREIVLLENSSGWWRPVREFALKGDTDSPWPALS